MGNWETLVSSKVGHRVPRALRIVCAGLFPLIPLCQAVAAGCDSSMTIETAVDHATLQVRGPSPAKRSLSAAVDSELMVFALERGIDVTLEVADASGHVLGRGDSPIRRAGVQRVRFPTRAGQRYSIVLTGKDRSDSNGSVDIRIVDLNRSASSGCVDVQTRVARADAAYAAGQAVTRAIAITSGASSEKSYEEAARGYREAADSLEATGPSPLLAQLRLAEASLLHFELDSFVKAMAAADQAARTFASLGDSYGEARARAILGAAATENAVTVKKSGITDAAKQASTMLADARSQLERLVAFHAGRKELYDQAWAQNYIGLGFYYEGRYDEAIKAYKKALPPYERLQQRTGQAQVLQNVALVEYELGRYSESAPHFHQVLNLIRRDENPKLYAAVLSNSALASRDSGNEDLALRELAESLAIARTIQDVSVQSFDLHNIASVYAKLGDQTRALDFYRQAHALFSSLQYVRGQTSAMRAMANILRQQGQAEEALKMDRETLSLEATPWARPRIMVQIAQDLAQLGRPRQAAESLEDVLRNEQSDEVVRARALLERARLQAADGNSSAAEADLKAALAVFKAYELPLDEFSDWLLQAQTLHRRGATGAAFSAIDQALALAEEVRLQSANPELRSTLLQPLRPAFDLKIRMLSEQYAAAKGDPQEQALVAMRALETAEQARARALADYQSLDVTSPGLDPTLLERRRNLYRELAARRGRLEERLDQKGTSDIQGQTIRSEIALLRQELDQIDAKIGAASDSRLARRPAVPQSNALQLNRIPPGVAVIEYWLGADSAFAWVVTREAVTMTPIGPTARIGSEAKMLHTALRSFGTVSKTARLEAGERLYALVLAPIESQIASNRTLIFAPDADLYYVPFATLRLTDSGHKVFLVQEHDIAVTPSIQMFLRPGPRRSASPSSKQMLLVDDPVYDPSDLRVTRSPAPAPATDIKATGPALALVRGAGSGRYLPRLPGAAHEADAIASLLPSDRIDRLDGFAANRERFLAATLDRYRLIHVASHATMDPEIPQASALILSTVDEAGRQIDGRVLGADFMNTRLNADAVVLSACDTALGKSVAGEGLIGLQYAVLARGARSVVSSLWPAIDQVTAELMVSFYSTLLRQHSTVISAWSSASRAALLGPYADPGTWGAFMLTLSHVEDLDAI